MVSGEVRLNSVFATVRHPGCFERIRVDKILMKTTIVGRRQHYDQANPYSHFRNVVPMTLLVRTDSPTGTHSYGDPTRSDHEVVELQLLLPRWQVDALEEAANQQGMTTGQMIRRVISNLFRPQR